MISITKKKIDNGAVYNMEVYRDNKCTWEYAIKVTGGDIDEQKRDHLAQMTLFKEFYEDAETDDFYELFNLIPMYKVETK